MCIRDRVRVASSTGVITSTTGGVPTSGTKTVVTFVYNVTDTVKEYVSVTTTTSLATGENRELLGTETVADSSLFESKIAIVEHSDFSQIQNQAGNSGNDNRSFAGVGSPGDSDYLPPVTDPKPGDNNDVIEIGELNNTGMLGADVQSLSLIHISEPTRPY